MGQAFPNTPPESVARGMREVYAGIEQAFGSAAAAQQSIRALQSFENAIIGLLITAAVITTFVYVLIWVFSRPDSELRKYAVQGSLRSFIVLFLMINIWTLVRMVNAVVALSDITAFVVYFVSFLMLSAWSLFSLGGAVTRTLSSAINGLFNVCMVAVREHIPMTKTVSDDAVRLALVAAIVVITGTSAVLQYRSTPENEIHVPSERIESHAGALPLIHAYGDATIENNTYVNKRYGIEISFPEGWRLVEATSSDRLLLAYNDKLEMWAGLNGGIFTDMASSTEQNSNAVLWRVEKNIVSGIARESDGILSARVMENEPVGGTTAASIHMSYFWRQPDGSLPILNEVTQVFGKGPVYFTLQFSLYGTGTDVEAINANVEEIVRTIRVSDPQLYRDV